METVDLQLNQQKVSEHHKFSSLHRYYAWSMILREQFQAPFDDFARTGDIQNGLELWMGVTFLISIDFPNT